MPGRSKDGYLRFRMAFWPLWRSEMIVLAVCSLLDSLLTRRQLGRWELKAIPIPWPHAVAIAAFFAGLCVAFPTFAREDGLRTFDDHGRYRHVAWGSLGRIQSFWFLGMRLLRIRVRLEGREEHVWVPCYLTKMRAFADFVAEHAGEDHPLTARLARYRTRAGAWNSPEDRL